ncbi:TPA: hypothetical protein EYN98_12590 [Candidatus Poribacteria bacterium]|nr:hypothetical protein [Candidatus Poribacteria bacterium]
MTLGVYTTLGKIGCLLKTHPMAEEWAKSAIKGINVSLESNHHLPDTTQDEWYGHLTLDMITQAGVFLKTAGFHNVFDDLRYKYGLDFYGQLLTPTDPHCNAGYIAPFGNGQATWNRSAVWGIAAYMMKESHPNFSERMQYYWKRAGIPVGMKISDRSDYGWINPHLPTSRPEFLSSSYFKQWGAVMRSGVGTDRETFMAMQLGKPGWYNAEGGFHLHTKGKPLCLVFGIRSWDVGQHNGFPNATMQRWMANRPTFDESKRMA